MEQDNSSHNGNGGATGVVEQAQQVASQAVGQVQEKASQAFGQAKETSGQVVGQVSEQAVSRLSRQKEQAAAGLGSVAEVLRHTGEELRGQEGDAITQTAAQYSEVAVSKIEAVSTYLREHEMSDVVRDVENFARREPVIFMGAAFLVGMLAARFLKSTAPSTPGANGNNAITPYVPPQALATTGASPVGTGDFGSGSTDFGSVGMGSYDATTGEVETVVVDPFDADTADATDIGPTPEEDSALT